MQWLAAVKQQVVVDHTEMVIEFLSISTKNVVLVWDFTSLLLHEYEEK